MAQAVHSLKDLAKMPPRTNKLQPSRLNEFLTPPGKYVPMFDAITSRLNEVDIINLRRVNSDVGYVYEATLRSQWNINTALGSFMDHPKFFPSQEWVNSRR